MLKCFASNVFENVYFPLHFGGKISGNPSNGNKGHGKGQKAAKERYRKRKQKQKVTKLFL